MDADLEFCLKRFVDEHVTDNMSQVAKLELNLKRKRTNMKDVIQHDDATRCQQENILMQQFHHDLNENNMAVNKTRPIIETEFCKALNSIKLDIETIAQTSTTKNNSRENNEEIRAASNKIRLQIARFDSELAHFLHIIDSNNSNDCSSRIVQRFRYHYGYANELNRMVGKNNSSGDLLVFSQQSLLVQSMLERVQLWNNRQKLIMKFAHQLDTDPITSKHLMDSLYRMTDTSSSLNFIQYYIKNRQEGKLHREEYLMHNMELEIEQQYLQQQILVIELVNALCQLSVNTTNEFQLNKKLKKALHQRELSEQVMPVFIDQNEEKTVEDLLLMLRLDTDSNKWTSNEDFIQQRFCLALCKLMQLPANTLEIERLEKGSVILHIIIHPPYGQSVFQQILGHKKDNESSISIIQTIQNCCKEFDSQIHSLVLGKYTLPIEECLMNLKWNNMNTTISGSNDNSDVFDSFEPENKQSLCPEGWKRFGIKVADNDTDLRAKWDSWHIAYCGTHGPYAPFILTSGLRVLSLRHYISQYDQVICLSPSIEYVAHPRHTHLWKKIENDGENYRYYQLVLQCRVNPAAVSVLKPETLLHKNHKTVQIDKDFRNEELEWIIQPDITKQEYIRDNIVCYGLMVRVIDGDPNDLPNLNWWKNSDRFGY